jgi:hypothetical protein
MAIDGKYGRVTLEHGTIGEDEPVIVFRARDKLLPEVLDAYYDVCLRRSSPSRHLDLILETRDVVVDWQAKNGSRIPTSEASREWMNH